ncbi:MAG: HD domain-containing phosphohydrolase [Thermus sp.]
MERNDIKNHSGPAAFVHAWHRLASLKEVKDVQRELLSQMREIVGAKAGVFLAYNPRVGALEVVEVQGPAPMPKGHRLGRGEGISWMAAQEGFYMLASGQALDLAYLGLAVRHPEGDLLGVVGLYLPKERAALPPGTRESLQLLAEAAGMILARRRALRKAQREARRFRKLLELASVLQTSRDPHSMAQESLRILLDLTPYHAGAFFLLEGGRFRPAVLVGQYPPGYLQLNQEEPVVEGMGLTAHPGLWQGPVHVEDYAQIPGALKDFVEVGLRSVLTAPVLAGGRRFGLLGLASFGKEVPFCKEDEDLIRYVAQRLGEAVEKLGYLQSLERNQEIILKVLARILEYRHVETSDHAKRVVDLSLRLGKAVGFADLKGLELGAYLHDLGKVVLPDEILDKKGPLVTMEWKVMKTHPEVGWEILRDIGLDSQTASNVVLYHHERWDGSGYPKGLKGEEIPLEARIFALADVYDALTHERPYKLAWSPEEAKQEIRAKAGKDFDPHLVRVFLDLVP